MVCSLLPSGGSEGLDFGFLLQCWKPYSLFTSCVVFSTLAQESDSFKSVGGHTSRRWSFAVLEHRGSTTSCVSNIQTVSEADHLFSSLESAFCGVFMFTFCVFSLFMFHFWRFCFYARSWQYVGLEVLVADGKWADIKLSIKLISIYCWP